MKTIKTKLDNNWVSFTFGEYKGEAKIFEEASHYGIAGGRISKLSIKNSEDEIVYNYDRGDDMDELPKGKLSQILFFLTNSDERVI